MRQLKSHSSKHGRALALTVSSLTELRSLWPHRPPVRSAAIALSDPALVVVTKLLCRRHTPYRTPGDPQTRKCRSQRGCPAILPCRAGKTGGPSRTPGRPAGATTTGAGAVARRNSHNTRVHAVGIIYVIMAPNHYLAELFAGVGCVSARLPEPTHRGSNISHGKVRQNSKYHITIKGHQPFSCFLRVH